LCSVLIITEQAKLKKLMGEEDEEVESGDEFPALTSAGWCVLSELSWA
jgi:hypothetical protein